MSDHVFLQSLALIFTGLSCDTFTYRNLEEVRMFGGKCVSNNIQRIFVLRCSVKSPARHGDLSPWASVDRVDGQS